MACGLFFGEQGPVVAERIDVEELEGGPHRVEGPLGDAQVIADVEDVVLDLPLAELIGRDHVVGGQLANSPQILAPGPFHQPGELQVTDHPLSEFGHGDTLSCVGTKSSGHSGRKLEGIKRSLRKVQTPARRTDSERSPIPRRSRFVQAKILTQGHDFKRVSVGFDFAEQTQRRRTGRNSDRGHAADPSPVGHVPT